MDELQKYLDILFADYGHSVLALEMKASVMVNMKRRMEALMAEGLDERAALAEIKDQVNDVGQLVVGNRLIYFRRFRNDCLQAAVIHALVAWIFSMPLIALLAWPGVAVSLLLMLATAAAAWFYITQAQPDSPEVRFVNAARYRQRRALVWKIWLLFFLLTAGLISVFTFAAGEPFKPTGGLAWAQLIARYYAPLLTVAFPLLVANMDQLIQKNEVGQEDLQPWKG